MKITPAPAFYNTGSLYRTRVNQSVSLIDSQKALFGTGSDASILYDGSNLIIKPDAVGSGGINLDGDTFVSNAHGVVIGHTAQETISIGDGATDLVPEVQVLGTAQADSSLMLAAFSTTATAAGAPLIALVKGGNATIGSHTIVTDGEELGNIIAFGDDGVDLEAPAAMIQMEVDGTPGAGDMPGRIIFATTSDGGETLAERLRISASGNVAQAGGLFLIGDSGSAGASSGVVINQAANDNFLLEFKSSDVAQAMTGIAEADTYAAFAKRVSTQGGLEVLGLSEAERAIWLSAYVDAVNTTKNAGADAPVMIRVAEHDGSNGLQNPSANANLFGVAIWDGSSLGVKFIVDEDGDIFYDGSAAAYDQYDDAAMARAFDLTVSPNHVIKNKWDEFVNYNEETLVATGILGDTTENRGLINATQLQRLHNGAISQIREDMMNLVRVLSPEQHAMLPETTRGRLALGGA
jgi:hypothetical protein